MPLTEYTKILLNNIASEIGTNPTWLYNLIQFESGWNPTIKNPNPESTARGLIQFTNGAARDLGYKDSLDLVLKNPSIDGQLQGPVLEYLKKYSPYPTEQSLYMGVFYPKFQFVPADTSFNETVQKWNPGITTVSDYMRKVQAGEKKKFKTEKHFSHLDLFKNYCFGPEVA